MTKKLRKAQKKEAIKRMETIGIMEEVINAFKKEGKIYLSEDGGMLTELNEDEQKMVKDFEKKSDFLVYLVIKKDSEEGIVYIFLLVQDFVDDWEEKYVDEDWEIENRLDEGRADAYALTPDAPGKSAFGEVIFRPIVTGLDSNVFRVHEYWE